MIGRALLISLVVCFLSLTSSPAFSLTPQPITYGDLFKTMKVIVKVTPGNNGQARYWWFKMRLLSLDGATYTIRCGKFDMSTVLDQPTTTDDLTLLEYINMNMASTTTMSVADQTWCTQ
jgi:hypothetical protein